MKKSILNFADWALANWLALVIFLTVFWMLMLSLVVLSWLFGYWSNGLNNTHFEIASCWPGVTAVAGAFASILALAKSCWTKYGQDSQLNTENGQSPKWGIVPMKKETPSKFDLP